MADATLKFDILGRDNVSPALRSAARSADDLDDRFGKVSRGMAAVGKAAVLGLAAGVGVGVIALKKFVGDARESERVSHLTESIIKSTGGAAKITAKQVGDLSTAISNKTGVDDEAIQTGSNLLLTFKNIRNEAGQGNKIFNQATAAAVDLSSAGFGSIDSASKMLGKALNDPLKGITALGRAGVTFSEQQKEQIGHFVKTGDLLKAQKIILGEVQSQVGGAAAATATPMQKLRVTLDNLGEAIGTKLLPYIDRAAKAIGDFVAGMQSGTGPGGAFAAKAREVGDRIRELAAAFQANILPRLQEFGSFIMGTVVPALSSMASFVKRNADFFVPFAATILAIVAAVRTWIAVQTALNFVLTANPIGLVVVAIAALVAGIVVAYQRSQTFRDVVNTSFHAIQTVVGNVASAIIGYFKVMLTVWLTVADGIISGAAKAFGWIPGIGGKLKAANDAFDHMKDKVLGTLGDMAEGASHWGDRAPKNLAAGMNGASGVPVAAAQGIANKTGAPFKAIASQASGVGADIAAGLAAGIRANSGAAIATAQGVANKIIATMREAAQTHSPSRITTAIGRDIAEGLGVGMRAGEATVLKAADALVGRITAAVDRLKSIRDEKASLGSSIFSAFNTSSLTNLGGDDPDAPVTAASMAANLAAKVQAAKVFAANLKALGRGGLNKQALADLAQQGFEQGGEFAAALVAGGKTAIGQINALQSQLTTAADQTASFVSGSMYDAGIKAAEGIIKGLKDRREQVLDALDHLGKAMAKKLRAALDIHSPSAVFGEIGKFVALGLVGGMQSKQGLVDRTVAGLVGSPLTPMGLGAAGAGSGGGTVVNLNVSAIDGPGAAAAVKGLLDEYVRRNGPLRGLTA